MGREKIKIMLFDYEGNYLQDYESISDCASNLSIAQPEISQCLQGSRLSANSFQFRRRLSNRTPERIGSLMNNRAGTFIVGKYWNSRLISTYRSLREAADSNNVEQGNISGSVMNGWLVNGFIYKKLN